MWPEKKKKPQASPEKRFKESITNQSKTTIKDRAQLAALASLSGIPSG
jgi:hypothetical protein